MLVFLCILWFETFYIGINVQIEVTFLSITFFIPVLVIFVLDELQYGITKPSTFCSEECIFDGSIT